MRRSVGRSPQLRAQPLLTWLRVIDQSLGIDTAVIAQKIYRVESHFTQSNVWCFEALIRSHKITNTGLHFGIFN